MNFLKNSHFALFVSFDIHAKILILHLAYHTHTYTDTHRHIQIPFSHFALFGSFGIHAKYIWHTTDLHMHRYSDICTETLTHRYRYTEIYASL